MILLYLFGAVIITLGCRTAAAQLSAQRVPSTYRVRKTERYKFTRSVSLTSRPGGFDSSSGQTTVVVLQLEVSRWSHTHGRWVHRGKPPSWFSRQSFCLIIVLYAYISYSASSASLCLIDVDPDKNVYLTFDRSWRVNLADSISLQVKPQSTSSNVKDHFGHRHMVVDDVSFRCSSGSLCLMDIEPDKKVNLIFDRRCY